MLESVAIAEFQKYLSSKPLSSPKYSFLEWLKSNSVKLANLPDGEQFWIKDAIRLAKS